MIAPHRSPDVYRLATVGRLTFFRFVTAGAASASSVISDSRQ